GRVRLGTSASISVYLLPRALGRLRARFPAIDLVVVTGTASDIARGLVGNDLDVGLVSLPLRDRELTVTPFYRDELVAIAPPAPRWLAAMPLVPSLVRHIGLVRRRDKPVAPPLAAFLDTLEDLRTALARRRRL